MIRRIFIRRPGTGHDSKKKLKAGLQEWQVQAA
jgi:hypothetical protein